MTEDELLGSNKLLAVKDMIVVLYGTDEAGEPTTVKARYSREFEIYRGAATGKDLESFSFEDRRIRLKGEERLPMSDYAVVYFTSPTAGLMSATEVGKPYSELTKAVSIEDRMENGALRHSIYSNVSEPLKVTEEEMRRSGPSKTFEIAATNLKALNGLVYLTIDPVMKDAAYYIPKDRIVILRLNVTNKSLIPVPETEAVTLEDGTAVRLPKDANYDTTSLSEAGLKEQFYYHGEEWSFKHNYSTYTFTGTGLADNGKADWVMAVPENTVSHHSLTSSTATQLLLFVPVYPKSLLGEITDAKKETVSSSWLRVGEKEYLEPSFKEMYQAAAAVAESERSAEQQSIVEAGRELAKLNPGYKAPAAGEEPAYYAPTYSYHGAKVDYHVNGYVYYSIPVRHFDDAKQPDPGKDGRYGVVRNALYYYHITGFTTLGATTPKQINDGVRRYDEEVDATVGGPAFADPDYLGRTLEL